jgi:hypothetical protein
LFHPRTDRWGEHFALEPETMEIRGITDVGVVTARLLDMNNPDRVIERVALATVDRFPTKPAQTRII